MEAAGGPEGKARLQLAGVRIGGQGGSAGGQSQVAVWEAAIDHTAEEASQVTTRADKGHEQASVRQREAAPRLMDSP